MVGVGTGFLRLRFTFRFGVLLLDACTHSAPWFLVLPAGSVVRGEKITFFFFTRREIAFSATLLGANYAFGSASEQALALALETHQVVIAGGNELERRLFFFVVVVVFISGVVLLRGGRILSR